MNNDVDDEEGSSGLMSELNEEQAAELGRLVLVAEDNSINQKVITSQLELLNYVYDVAGDGQEALAMWSQKPYSILLTDLHMPIMDGYDLARMIRKRESKDHRIPIVVFTANATKDEKQRCLEIGIDDYLIKPVPLEKLEEKLNAWAVRKSVTDLDVARERLKNEQANSAFPVLDTAVLDSLLGSDDPGLMEEFLDAYRQEVLQAKTGIQQAVQDCNWHGIGEIAHSLKSSSRSVGAMALGEICATLEIAGRQSDETAIRSTLVSFSQSLEELEKVLLLE